MRNLASGLLVTVLLGALLTTACRPRELDTRERLAVSDRTVDHSGFSRTCVACHEKDRPAIPHVAVGDCVQCHVGGTHWLDLKSFDHAPPLSSCVRCHEKERPQAASNNFSHALAGMGDCVSCHLDPGGSWSAASYSHSPVPGVCANCHLNAKPATVVNRMDHAMSGVGDCVSCHLDPGGSWSGGRYGHAPLPVSCQNCHETQRPVLATSRGFEHQRDCAECHDDFHQGFDCLRCHSSPGVSWGIKPLLQINPEGCEYCHDGAWAPRLGPVLPSAPNLINDGNTVPSISSTPVISWGVSAPGTYPISHYEIAIGTSLGGSQVKGWTNVGKVTSAMLSDLSLGCGTYYASIRAVDTQGFASAPRHGDGWVATHESCKKLEFQYNGTEQYFVIPPGVSEITVQAWGGGGGGSEAYVQDGFGGSYARQVFAVSDGTTYRIRVGGGGKKGVGGWPNGAKPSLSVSGGGGGGTSLRKSDGSVLMEAAGGSGNTSGGGLGGGTNKGTTVMVGDGLTPANYVSPCLEVTCGRGGSFLSNPSWEGSSGWIRVSW